MTGILLSSFGTLGSLVIVLLAKGKRLNLTAYGLVMLTTIVPSIMGLGAALQGDVFWSNVLPLISFGSFIVWPSILDRFRLP